MNPETLKKLDRISMHLGQMAKNDAIHRFLMRHGIIQAATSVRQMGMEYNTQGITGLTFILNKKTFLEYQVLLNEFIGIVYCIDLCGVPITIRQEYIPKETQP